MSHSNIAYLCFCLLDCMKIVKWLLAAVSINGFRWAWPNSRSLNTKMYFFVKIHYVIALHIIQRKVNDLTNEVYAVIHLCYAFTIQKLDKESFTL